MKRKHLFLLTVAMLLAGCGGKSTPTADGRAEADSTMRVGYAKGFTVEYLPEYKRVTVHSPWEEGKELAVYYLVKSEETATPEGGIKMVVPLKSLAVTSCTHFEFLDMLGELRSVTGICSPELAYNAEIASRYGKGEITNLGDAFSINFENLLMLSPDAVMLTSYSQQDETVKRLNTAGTTVVYNNEWTENTLLARAEWMKYVSAFYDKESLADSLFRDIERNYKEAMRLVADAEEIGKPSVLAGGNYKGTWYMPGGESYMGKLFEDAGCSYFYSDDPTTTSIPLNFETVLYNFSDADIWLNAPTATLDELLKMDERHGLFRAAKEGNVYGFYARINDKGANDFWESAVAHPDIVLRDVIWAVHPELTGDYKPTYIIKLK